MAVKKVKKKGAAQAEEAVFVPSPAPEGADLSHIPEAYRHLAVTVESVIPDPRNARHHPRENINQIKASLREFGQDIPLVANRNTGKLVKGHGRLLSMKELKWQYVAVLYVSEDDAASIARGIADNVTGDSSTWDLPSLKSLLGDVQTSTPELKGLFVELDEWVTRKGGDGLADAGAGEPIVEQGNQPQIAEMDLKPFEHYDYIVILSRQVHDWNRLCEVLGLQEYYRGDRKIGMGRGVWADKVLELIDAGGSVQGKQGKYEGEQTGEAPEPEEPPLPDDGEE